MVGACQLVPRLTPERVTHGSAVLLVDVPGRLQQLTNRHRHRWQELRSDIGRKDILFDCAGDGKPIHIAWTARR